MIALTYAMGAAAGYYLGRMAAEKSLYAVIYYARLVCVLFATAAVAAIRYFWG